MIYTAKIKQAIKFAIKTHEVYQKQKRKGKDSAYISHPLTVGLILSLAGAWEDVIVAGILHDTIEDSIKEKKVTKEMLVERFGENVAQLVLSVTEENKELSWDERKQIALDHIKGFSHDSLLVKSADVISNLSELLEDYDKDKDKVFLRFNAPKEKTIENKLKVITAILNVWQENPLAGDLKYLGDRLQMTGAVSFMRAHPAGIIQYSEYDKDMAIECPVCGWQGTPRSSGCINMDSDFALDVSCPNCDKMILVAEYALANP